MTAISNDSNDSKCNCFIFSVQKVRYLCITKDANLK